MRLLISLFFSLVVCTQAWAQAVAPWEARFGRTRALVAVVGANAGTELTDFMAPYAVIARAGNADVLALATGDGPIQLRPRLRIGADATLAQFDQRHPDGADYVIVPALSNANNPVLLPWLAAQAAKGATIVSICDGALVAARAGVFKGHRATGHWATHAQRTADFPDTEWLRNRRYVADGKAVSSAGVSAAIPTALAVVEAIAGRERAASVAAEIGVQDWSARHDSAQFTLSAGLYLTAIGNRLFRSRSKIGIALTPAMDELGLALYVDAMARTYRTTISLIGSAPVPSRHGLLIYPDLADASGMDRMHTPGTQPLRSIMAAIEAEYGAATARLVAAQLEYTPDAPGNF